MVLIAIVDPRYVFIIVGNYDSIVCARVLFMIVKENLSYTAIDYLVSPLSVWFYSKESRERSLFGMLRGDINGVIAI